MRTIKKHRNDFKSSESYFAIFAMDQKTKTDKLWLCESVGKLKGIGQLAKAKMNELSIHTISNLQLHVCHHGIPKVPI